MRSIIALKQIKYWFPVKIMSFLALAFLLCQCKMEERKVAAIDKQSLHYLEMYLEQESLWAGAIGSMDSVAASRAIDSMQTIAKEFLILVEFPENEPGSEYFQYFEKLRAVREYLYLLSDSAYPAITQIAFLPRLEYTRKEEALLMNEIHQIDSILDRKLEELQQTRILIFARKAEAD